MPNETGPIIIQVADAVTNAATTILTLQHTTSGTPASGIGSLLAFQAQSLSGSAVVNADISGILTDVTSGAEKGALVLRTTTGGSLSERWRITDTGILQANGAQTIQTSTGALTLATAGGNGNIILSPNGSGNVGIGTTSPASRLTVTSTAGSGDVLITGVGEGNSDISRLLFMHQSYNPNPIAAITMRRNSFGANGNLVFQTASLGNAVSDRMIIDYNGNLGIGTTNPGCRLDVVGDLRGNQYLRLLAYPGYGSGEGFLYFDGNNGWFRTDQNLYTNSNLIVFGSVGIGTAAPARKLDIGGNIGLFAINAQRQFTYAATGDSNTDFWFRSTTSFINHGANAGIFLARLAYQSAGTGNDLTDNVGLHIGGFYDNSGDGLPIYLGGYAYNSQTPAVTITDMRSDGSGGNLGVGTATPSYGAHVLRNASGGIDLIALENSSTASVTTKFAGIALRGTSTASASKDAVYLRAYPDGVDYSSTHLSLWTRTSDTMTERWQITSSGVLQAMGGPQTIQTNTGALTLATGGGNGNIILSPQGTGMVTLGEPIPTNYFHVSNSACGGIDLIAIENSSSGNCVTKFAGYAMRGRDTSGSRMDTGYLRCFPGDANYGTSRLSFWSRFSSTTMVERMGVGALKNVTTNNAALPLFNISLAAGQTTGGMIAATVEVSDGTDYQSLTQIISFAAVNKGGTFNPQLSTVNSLSAPSSGTLSASWSLATGTNQVTLQVTPNSSLTSYTFYRVTFTVFNHSPQALTFL
jgi:hypothetical protein